jgi:hypothetical protein
MFDPQTVTMAVGILAALSISGLAYALLSPLMDRQDKKDRINKVALWIAGLSMLARHRLKMQPIGARTSPLS